MTGAAKRLGAVMVRALARPDRVIVIQTFSSRPQADELAAELSGQGTPVVVVAADLASDTAVRGLIDAAASAAGGPITGLVNGREYNVKVVSTCPFLTKPCGSI